MPLEQWIDPRNPLAFWSAARLKSGECESNALQLLAPLWIAPAANPLTARTHRRVTSCESKAALSPANTLASHPPPCSRAAVQNASESAGVYPRSTLKAYAVAT